MVHPTSSKCCAFFSRTTICQKLILVTFWDHYLYIDVSLVRNDTKGRESISRRIITEWTDKTNMEEFSVMTEMDG